MTPSNSLERFGTAGVPLHQFDVRLRFGYRLRVAVWETRRDMRRAVEHVATLDLKSSWVLHGATAILDGRQICVVHLCLPALTDDVVIHETFHALREYERRIRHRYKSDDGLEEMLAREMASTYLAVKSHIAEERRLSQ